jgi:hypothetical protein
MAESVHQITPDSRRSVLSGHLGRVWLITVRSGTHFATGSLGRRCAGLGCRGDAASGGVGVHLVGLVFLINLPVIALLLLIGPFLLPEYRAPQQGRFDVLGAVLSLGAVLATSYGVKKLAIEAWSAVPAAALGGC